jgi:hypothetical protein
MDVSELPGNYLLPEAETAPACRVENVKRYTFEGTRRDTGSTLAFLVSY